MPKTLQNQGARLWRVSAHPLYPANEHEITWLNFLPPKKNETRHQREYLRLSARQFISRWIQRTESKYGQLSPGTIRAKYKELRTLTNWMVSRGIWRYKLLSKIDLIEFLEVKLMGRAREAQVSKRLSRATMQQYINLLDDLWSDRDHYVGSLNVDVRAHLEFANIAARGRANEQWRPISLPAATSLVKTSLQRIDSSADLEALVNEVWDTSKAWVGKTVSERRSSSRALHRQISVRHRATELASHGQALKETSFLGAVEDVVAASLLLILLFSGMRISEALSLSCDCLEQRPHSDGVNYWYVKGIAAKKKGKERMWVIPDVIVSVVQLMERLFRPIRMRYQLSCLFISKAWRMEILTGRVKPDPLSKMTANILMRRFADANLDAAEMVDGVFHAHRARKTFARFVVMRDKSALESLAHHYGHVYAAVLDRHYVGNDFALSELVKEEDLIELRMGILSLLNSASIGGKAGLRLMSQRDDLAFRGKLTIDLLAERLIAEGVVLAPCDWGYCVYAKEESKCRGSVIGPNPLERAPSVCASCNNFAVVDRHLPWWERRAGEQEAFLLRPDISEQSRRIVSQQFEASQRILHSVISRDREK